MENYLWGVAYGQGFESICLDRSTESLYNSSLPFDRYKYWDTHLIITSILKMIYSAFTSLTVAVLLGLTGPSLGTNHISGLAVSNSAGGTGTYSCRSQDQVTTTKFSVAPQLSD